MGERLHLYKPLKATESSLRFNCLYWVFYIDVSSIFQNNFCFCFPLCNVLRYEDGYKLSLVLRKITSSNQTLMDYTR